jgi:hypothetical protein
MTLPYGFIYEMDEPLWLVTGFGPVVRSRDGRGPEAGATQRRVRGVLPDGGEGDGLLWARWSPDGTKIAYAQGRDV